MATWWVNTDVRRAHAREMRVIHVPENVEHQMRHVYLAQRRCWGQLGRCANLYHKMLSADDRSCILCMNAGAGQLGCVDSVMRSAEYFFAVLGDAKEPWTPS